MCVKFRRLDGMDNYNLKKYLSNYNYVLVKISMLKFKRLGGVISYNFKNPMH